MKKQFNIWMTFVAVFIFVNSGVFVKAESPKFTLTKIDSKVIVKIGDQTFAEYVFDDPATNKSYLWPVYGPTGKAMTRSYPMKEVEGEVKDHYHHRGIWFGHQDIGGYNSWAERKTYSESKKNAEAIEQSVSKLGSQKHRSFKSMSTGENHATLVIELDYLDGKGEKNLSEIRTLIFGAEGKTRMIDFNQEFIASAGDITLGDEKDAGLCIRVPTTMSVDSKKGGVILNSEGIKDKEAWGKRAKWCDYSGPVEDETLGVAIFNHPSSFRYPTTWHVRTYGLFTANPFGTLDPAVSPNGPHTLKAGEKLLMKHRFVLHDGDFDAEKINAAYQRYTETK